MNSLVSMILRFLSNQKVINQDEDTQAFYRYGIELCISSILNIVLVLLIGIILNCILESIVFLIVFIFLRSFMGGYHASTYFRCNLLMCTSFVLLFLIYDNITLVNNMLFFVISITYIIVITLLFCPVENPNKPIPKEKQSKLKLLSIILGIMFYILAVVLINNNIKFGIMIVLTETLISTLVIIAKLKERSLMKNDKIHCKTD